MSTTTPDELPPLPVQPLEVTAPALHEAWYRKTFPPVEQVRDDIWSIPIPFQGNPMRYTLCYLLIGDGEAVVIDPGWDSAEGFDAFRAGLGVAGVELREVSGALITHVHPDHHGLTHYLTDAVPGMWVGMSAMEQDSLAAQRGVGSEERRAGFLRQVAEAGVPADAGFDAIQSDSGNAMFERMPLASLQLGDGDLVPLAGRQVRAVLTPGHTPGHLSFIDEHDDVIFTGDHVLPRISPNVGLHAHARTSPLRAYLSSLARLADVDHEVLPAHQWRFRGLPERVAELRAHHRARLDEILGLLDAGPITSWALAERLTWAHGWEGLGVFQRWSAVAETAAHLLYLVEDGVVTSSGDAPTLYRVA